MIYAKGFGQVFILFCFQNIQLRCRKLHKIVFEVLQEQIIIRAREKLKNIVIIFLKMLKQMKKNGIRCVAVKNMSVLIFFTAHRIKNVAEKLLTKLL